jgi:hypothetical protein
MRTSIALVLLFFCFYINTNAQRIVSGRPVSFLTRLKQPKTIRDTVFKALDTTFLQKTDSEKKINNRYGIVNSVNINIKTCGTKTVVSGKGYIWQYQISVPNAKAIGLRFSSFILPPEAELYIYNKDHSQVLGAFTYKNNNTNNALSIADLKGDTAIIEYFEPLFPQFEGELTIGFISQAYRSINYSTTESTSTTRVGINCTAGADWQDDKHAVCRMIFNDSQYSYYCTGSLVNNTSKDGTPYFLTANHCISTSSVAATLVTYFNYENSTCSGSDASTSQTLSGATLKANSKYSDFCLLLLDEAPPETYEPYFAGWDRSGTAATSSAGIHHPAGTPKCIAIDNDACTSYNGRISWDDGVISSANTHWETTFDTGETEGGSSGSPLFNQDHRVIGQLHGGGDGEDFYGKFSLSWNFYSTASAQLKVWLDPNNTGATTLDGTYLEVAPKSLFTSSSKAICKNDTIILYDKSKYSPETWSWSISPRNYEYVNGTDSTTQDPQVVFNQSGAFNISLITANDYGSDTLSKNNYIVVVSGVTVAMANIPSDSTICGCDLNAYTIKGSGATTYTYSVQRGDKISYSTSDSIIYLTVLSSVKKAGNFNSWLYVTGTTGSCSSKDSALLKIVMPVNDNIANATSLWPGLSGSYQSKCASKENNEPYPSGSDCYSSNSWCNTSLNGSLWFTFYGPSNGLVNIHSTGINSRIALYDFNDTSNFFTGSYSMLAANDNISSTDSTAELNNISVDYGKKYWLQVDKDNTSITGNCYIELWSNSVSILPTVSQGNFNLIISSAESGDANVEIFNTIGQLVYSNVLSVTNTSNQFQFNLNLQAGIYLMKVTINGNKTVSKFVITN